MRPMQRYLDNGLVVLDADMDIVLDSERRPYAASCRIWRAYERMS